MKRNVLRFVALLTAVLFLWGCKGSKESVVKDNPARVEEYVFQEPEVSGNTFYIDPAAGSPDGDGSVQNPWRTLQEMVEGDLIACYRHVEANNPASALEPVNPEAPVKGGDQLLLRSGYHGHIALNYFIFKEWLTIAAENGHTPVLAQLRMEGAFEKIYLKNITILKQSYRGVDAYWQAEALNRNDGSCIYLASSSFWGEGREVKMNGLTVKTAENTSSWSAGDWVEKSASGISLRSAKKIEIVNCTIENVRHGISMDYFSDNSVAVNNTINNYSGDGCRLIGNDLLFAYNTITNCYDVDENHDDAIQSWSRGADNSPGTGVLRNVVIRGNLIIGTPDSNNPLPGNPQGIGCFDGFFENWTIENNVVVTDHYHGISFYGMRNGKIVNNTVIDQIPGNDTSPWILVNPHKDGTASENCIVANNIVSAAVTVEGNEVEAYNNFIIGRNTYDRVYLFFLDPDNQDMHLLLNDATAANIIDKGAVFPDLISTKIDRDRKQRTSPPDLGAYEADQ
jgi:parallel beta-helix repeat protein